MSHGVVTSGIADLIGPLSLMVDKAFAAQVLEIFERDGHFSLTQAVGPERFTVLEQEIDLGMSVIYGEKIVPTERCIAAIRMQATAPAGEPFEIELSAKDGSAFQRIFPKWVKVGTSLPPDAEKALADLHEKISRAAS